MSRTCPMREAPRQWRYWRIVLRQRLSPPPTFVDEWWFQISQLRLAPHQEALTTPQSLPEANSTPVLPRSSATSLQTRMEHSQAPYFLMRLSFHYDLSTPTCSLSDARPKSWGMLLWVSMTFPRTCHIMFGQEDCMF